MLQQKKLRQQNNSIKTKTTNQDSTQNTNRKTSNDRQNSKSRPKQLKFTIQNSKQQLILSQQQQKQKQQQQQKPIDLLEKQLKSNEAFQLNKKKFQLYCQVKKKKILMKKINTNKQTIKLQSAKNKQSRYKSQIVQTKLNPQIKIIDIQNAQNGNILKLQNQTSNSLLSDQRNSSKRKTSSTQQATLNIKKSWLRTAPVNSSSSNISQQSSSCGQKITQFTIQPIQDQILIQKNINQQIKGLSFIQQQDKQQDTLGKTLKESQQNVISPMQTSKNYQQTINLSINSVYHQNLKNMKMSIHNNTFLQVTTQFKESILKKSIEQTLSQLEKYRPKINIQKFKVNKKFQQGNQEEIHQRMTFIQKIQFHIEIINSLSNFVYKSTQLEYLMDQWDQLNFLIYKKFYLQRVKVYHFLKKYPIKNPFSIRKTSIDTKQLLKGIRQNEHEIKRITSLLEKQNQIIKNNLTIFFSQFQKQIHGQKINILQYDNFSQYIYKQLWSQIQLFSFSQSHNQVELQDRICRSLQAGFLIAQLNGNYVTPFQDAQIACHRDQQNIYIDDNLKSFQRYVLNKNS